MANPLTRFNDSESGIVLGTVLHTLGAILLLAALVAYVVWAHRMKARHMDPTTLVLAAVLGYVAVIVNLVGGFMRTYQSDHPGLSEFSTSPWVRVLLVKHIFLFVAMGAMVFLVERVAKKWKAAQNEGEKGAEVKTPSGHALGVSLVTIGILVAALLGALTQVVDLRSPTGDPDGTDHNGHEPGQNGTVELVTNATGQLTSTPLIPATSTGTFVIPENVTRLEATLLWDPTQFSLGLLLAGPDGETVDLPQTGGGRLSGGADNPSPGTWEYTIHSDLAVNVSWRLRLQMTQEQGHTFLADTITIPAGTFYEINTEMPLNGTMWWDWSTSAVVHFDVHTHFDNEVQYLVEEDADEGAGNLTADREGGYSYLWENTGSVPVTLEYEVWGDFTLDSIFPA